MISGAPYLVCRWCFLPLAFLSGTWSYSSETDGSSPDPDELSRASPATTATAGARHPSPRPASAAGDGLRAAGLCPPRAARVPGKGRQVRARARQQRPARCCAHAGRAWRGQVSPSLTEGLKNGRGPAWPTAVCLLDCFVN